MYKQKFKNSKFNKFVKKTEQKKVGLFITAITCAVIAVFAILIFGVLNQEFIAPDNTSEQAISLIFLFPINLVACIVACSLSLGTFMSSIFCLKSTSKGIRITSIFLLIIGLALMAFSTFFTIQLITAV